MLHIKHTNVSARDTCQCCIMKLGVPFKQAEFDDICSLKTGEGAAFPTL